MKVLLKVVVIFILLVLFVSGILFYLQVSNRDCSNISEYEAKQMIERILEHKKSRSEINTIFMDYQLEDIEYSSFKIDSQHSSDLIGSVDLLYTYKDSGIELFTAVIYENCEVQWIFSHDT